MVFHGPSPGKNIDILFEYWEAQQIFSPIDLSWGRFVIEYFAIDDPELVFTVIFLSHLVGQNHIVLDLDYWQGRSYPESTPNHLVTFATKENWLKNLRGGPQNLLQKVETEQTPSSLIVINKEKLYFNKYFHYEKNIAHFLKDRTKKNGILIISGGPGTGKTTMVFAKIVETLKKNPKARIILLAPTGKAARRLQEAVKQSRDQQGKKILSSLNLPNLKKIPDTVYTVHHFLDLITHPPSVEWRKTWDLVVLDEASMVSFPLFYDLLFKIKESHSLILLGDKDQLSSVEEGSLFYELADVKSPLSSHIIFLKKNYRYSEDSLIAQTAKAMRSGGKETYTLMKSLLPNAPLEKSGDFIYFPNYGRKEVDRVGEIFFKPNYQKVFTKMISYLQEVTSKLGEQEIIYRDQILTSLFQLYRSQMILCARKKGLWGVEEMNRIAGEWIGNYRKNIHSKFPDYHRSKTGELLRVGDPIILNRTRYELDLFNGDIGIVFLSPEEKNQEKKWVYRVFFEKEGGYRNYPPEILGDYDLAHALTVHKSQGSEFDYVIAMITGDNEFLTREICYTALTRARKKVFFFMKEDQLKEGLHRVGIRHSGLRESLKGGLNKNEQS